MTAGRPRKVDDATLIAAVGRIVVDEGAPALTTRRVSELTGVPNGSIYHRFVSRDGMVGAAWLDAVERFQEGYLHCLGHVDVDTAARTAAEHVPSWAHSEPTRAALLLRHRRSELVHSWPAELVDRLDALNGRIAAALREHARRRYDSVAPHHLAIVKFALIDVPESAVRSTDRPESLVHATGAAALAVLGTVT